ncbi:MAG: hypothetical protein QNJ09_00880 [Paracoccaceae bacterium]|nr:hypothetical protein [Paracoccaceae bacterium]
MSHLVEQHSTTTLHDLRKASFDMQVTNGQALIDGVYVGWDATGPEVRMTARSAPGQLLSIEMQTDKVPGWVEIAIWLGWAGFLADDVFGVVAKLSGCAGLQLPLLVRTERDETHDETLLQDALTGSDTPMARTALHTIGPDETFTRGDGAHALVLRLPRRDLSLDLQDLRVFLMPAFLGLPKPPAAAAL